MRVTSVFNTVFAVAGADVVSVSVTGDGVVVGLRRRFRLLMCPCGRRWSGCYDRSVRRWRHLDCAGWRVWLQAEIRRVYCRDCRAVRTEVVPWARPTARHTSEFEQLVVWLAQRMDKTAVAELMRCSWEAVDHIVARVVAEHLTDSRLDGLRRIGVDEISYKRGHRYLTVVADHDTGRVVWVGLDRSRETFAAFFAQLGPRRCAELEAITMDASAAYLGAAAQAAPQARICLDPFHIIGWTNEALDLVYRGHPTPPVVPRRDWRKARYALRAGQENLSGEHRDILNRLRRGRYHVGRAWELKEALRTLYRTVEPAHAARYLNAWCTAAARSRIPAFQTLAKRLRTHFDKIVAAVELGLSNSRLEGINSKIRVIQRRGYGHPSAESLTTMIHLCIGDTRIELPTRT